MASKSQLLFAAKAVSIPEGRAGLWLIEKTTYKIPVQTIKGWLPMGTYTHLYHFFWWAKRGWQDSPPGEDHPYLAEALKPLLLIIAVLSALAITIMSL